MRARLSVLLMASLFCLSHGLWGCGSGGDGTGSDPTPPPAIDITGNAMAVWEQGTDIWANRFD